MTEDEIKDRLEETVTFKVGDKIIYGVMGYDGNEFMCSISGYDLQISFNMRLINSLSDAEAMANGIADVMYKALMEELIAEKPALIKQENQ